MGQVATVQDTSQDSPGGDESVQSRAAALAASRRRLFVSGTALNLALPILIWVSGLSGAGWALLTVLPHWVATALYLIGFWALLSLANAPLAFWGGHVLQHRYGLARQTATGWLVDWCKGTGVALLLATFASVAFYATVWSFGEHWWWTLGAVLSVASLLFTYLTPYVIVPLFFRPRPLDRPEIVEAVVRLIRKAGTEVAGVCSLDFSRRTEEANAAVLGLGRSRRVALADTLLERFTLPEIESVVAHELAHHVHRDMLRLFVIQSGVLFAGLYAASYLAPFAWSTFGRPELGSTADFPLVWAAAELAGLLLMPIGNAVSRAFEASADRYAIRLTGDPAAFVGAMRRLSSQNLVEERPPRWAELLLYTHPPIYRRIAAAREVGVA